MLLITLDKVAIHCRVELDGQDISKRLCRIEVDADIHGHNGNTLVRMTLLDDVTIIGEAGSYEFVTRPGPD